MDEKRVVKRYYLNLVKTQANIRRLVESRDLKLKEAGLAVGLTTPQGFQQRVSGKGLPTVEEFIGLTHLLQVPFESLVVVDEIDSIDEDFNKVINKAHENNPPNLAYIIDEIYPGDELYDNPHTRALGNEYTSFFSYSEIDTNTNVYLYMQAGNEWLFKDENDQIIDNGIGNISFSYFLSDKKYDFDLRVPGFEEWYKEYKQNWLPEKRWYKAGFDINGWNNKGIELVKDMYNILPENFYIYYANPAADESVYNYYGGWYLVPKNSN